VGGDCSGACRSGARARQLTKRWAAIARVGPRAFAINAGAEAQASPRQSATSARASGSALMPLRVASSRPVQELGRQQRQVTSGSLPCGPTVYAGGHARCQPASALTQTWSKFGPGMGRAGRASPDASHRWEDAGDVPERSDQIGRTRTRCVGPLEMASML
jgi:hypothetical protein